MDTALDALNRLKVAIGGGSDSLIKKVIINESKNGNKSGVIYVLSNESGKYYIGFEYEGNIENEIKDLIVRSIAYDKMGYLYEASNEIFKNPPVKMEILEKVNVSSRIKLAEVALNHMLEMGMDRCVNIWNPVDMLGKVVRVRLIWGNNKMVKVIDRYKLEKENEMLGEFLEEGYDLHEARMLMLEKRKDMMNEIRKLKDYLYDEWIII